jgi:hypothetical protein
LDFNALENIIGEFDKLSILAFLGLFISVCIGAKFGRNSCNPPAFCSSPWLSFPDNVWSYKYDI